MKHAKLPNREFSFAVNADDIASTPVSFSFSPNESERAAIAKRLDVLSLTRAEAKIECTRESGHIIHVRGEFSADITQECVVTLDPIQSTIGDEFESWFSDKDHIASFKKAQIEAKAKKEFIETPMLEEHEDPEPLENGKIDVGELFVQFLSLAVNPYPQKPGVRVADVTKQKSDDDQKFMPQNPFAALKNWRPKD
jgi:hypothetical protein